MRRIRLTNNKYALIDNSDFDKVSAYKWHANFNGGRWYAANQSLAMHRLIMNAPKHLLVDHINIEKTLDNRKQNLRFANRSQNMGNSVKKKKASSKYKGVTHDTFKNNKGWKNPWRVRLVQQFIGRFPTERLAARAYDTAAIEYYGEFAKTNFKIKEN